MDKGHVKPVAIVTGAAGGIGAACAELLLEEGYEVHGWDVAAGPLEGVRWMVVDVADYASVAHAASSLTCVDALVNCAGLSEVCASDQVDPQRFAKIMAVNVNGTFFTTRALVEALSAEGGATVVNIGSIAGHRAGPRRSAYGASKAAVIALTQILATDLAPLGIRVIAVSPGYVNVGMLSTALEDGTLDRSTLLARIPSGRLVEPQELAGVVHQLLQPQFAAIVGSTVLVDGGWLANGAY